MRILTVVFVLALIVAHRDGGVIDQPLSMFRDGSQHFFGEFLFLLLGLMGGLLIRQLCRFEGYTGATILSAAYVLLLIVALTQSHNRLHEVCAIGPMVLIGGYYTAWIGSMRPIWLGPHLFLMLIVVIGAVVGTYGFWQKGFICYLVLLINLHYSSMEIPRDEGWSMESWRGMRVSSAMFVVALGYAHWHDLTLDLPLSMLRETNHRFIGAILFLLLGVIGAIQIRKLLCLRGYAGGFTLIFAFGLLVIVTLTRSVDPFHNLCAFGLLSTVGLYYTLWLNLEKPDWVWQHLLSCMFILCGAMFGSYGFWQKAFILYLVALINVQHSILNRIPPEIGVQYALNPDASPPPRQAVYELDREFYTGRSKES